MTCGPHGRRRHIPAVLLEQCQQIGGHVLHVVRGSRPVWPSTWHPCGKGHTAAVACTDRPFFPLDHYSTALPRGPAPNRSFVGWLSGETLLVIAISKRVRPVAGLASHPTLRRPGLGVTRVPFAAAAAHPGPLFVHQPSAPGGPR